MRTDFTEDLKKFDFPTLVFHGEDDQIVPVKDSAKKSAKLIKGAREIYYPVNADFVALPAGIGQEPEKQRSIATAPRGRPDSSRATDEFEGRFSGDIRTEFGINFP